MKPLLCILFIAISLSISAKEESCHYAGAFESIRLKVDYDPVFGASELYLQTIFQSEGGRDISLLDRRVRIHPHIVIEDDGLGELFNIPDKQPFSFEKGSGKIKIGTVVGEKDYGFPRFWNYPMVQNRLIDPNDLEWQPSEDNEYEESAVVWNSNDNVDVIYKLYRICLTG